MAFETRYMETYECCLVCSKYDLARIPYNWYRYDKDNDFYLYIAFGTSYNHPGLLFLIWKKRRYDIIAYPADEHWNFWGDGPEKKLYLHMIVVPKKFDKLNELLDLIEQAFTGFEGDFNSRFSRFSIVNNREQLRNIIHYI